MLSAVLQGCVLGSFLVLHPRVWPLLVQAVARAGSGQTRKRLKRVREGIGHMATFRADLLQRSVLQLQLPAVDAPESLAGPKASKRVVFVRHGESIWNAVFNRRGRSALRTLLFLLCRLVVVLLQEVVLWTTSDDSHLWDAPLSSVGEQEAQALAQSLERDLAALLQLDESCAFACSPLRRAGKTAAVALGPRVMRSAARIEVLPCLREVSRNVDSVQLLEGKAPAKPASLFALRQRDESSSLSAFAEWVFAEEGDVVVVGHSGWLKRLFIQTMPGPHIGKRCKLRTCGVLSFELQRDDAGLHIDPSSVVEIYRGFEGSGHFVV